MAGIGSKAELKTKLQDLDYEIDDKDIQFILENGEKYVGDPDVLSIKLGISEDQAVKIVEVIQQYIESTNQLTAEIKEKIEKFIEQHPSITTHKIALLCEINERTVNDYLKEKQEPEIQDEKGKGSFSIVYLLRKSLVVLFSVQ